jgi:hypothetical protein
MKFRFSLARAFNSVVSSLFEIAVGGCGRLVSLVPLFLFRLSLGFLLSQHLTLKLSLSFERLLLHLLHAAKHAAAAPAARQQDCAGTQRRTRVQFDSGAEGQHQCDNKS